MKSKLIAATALAAATPSLAAPPANVVGGWSQESSGKELVIVPKIKLQPNWGYTPGTNLGGSAGIGSPTRTTIVTEPTMLDVQRKMGLHIRPDGSFTWLILRMYSEDGKCTRTTLQEKTGTVDQAGGELVFAVAGGTERWEKSCGSEGSGPIKPQQLRYRASVAGKTLTLSGPSERWTFNAGAFAK